MQTKSILFFFDKNFAMSKILFCAPSKLCDDIALGDTISILGCQFHPEKSGKWACSSVVERYVDIVEAISSILITPTKSIK